MMQCYISLDAADAVDDAVTAMAQAIERVQADVTALATAAGNQDAEVSALAAKLQAYAVPGLARRPTTRQRRPDELAMTWTLIVVGLVLAPPTGWLLGAWLADLT